MSGGSRSGVHHIGLNRDWKLWLTDSRVLPYFGSTSVPPSRRSTVAADSIH